MKSLRVAALVAAAVVLAGRAHAQTQTVTGSFNAPRNATQIAQDFDSGWNQGSFFCRVGSPTLIAWPESGACIGREVRTTFAVTTGGGTTVANHTFTYRVFCAPGNIIRHEVAFDGGALTPIDSNVFTFNLTGGDTLQLTTSEGLQAVIGPALSGRAVLACAALLSLALLCLLRRGRTGTFS